MPLKKPKNLFHLQYYTFEKGDISNQLYEILGEKINRRCGGPFDYMTRLELFR